jgi:hypothetical protein
MGQSIDGWEKRLIEKLESTKGFEWGVNDCCLFAADCVQAMTGIDHASEFRGYKTATGAYKRLKKAGGLVAVMDSKLRSVPVKFAKRGDVIAFENGEEYSLGICIGDKIAAVSDDGLIYLPMNKAVKAWAKQ